MILKRADDFVKARSEANLERPDARRLGLENPLVALLNLSVDRLALLVPFFRVAGLCLRDHALSSGENTFPAGSSQ